MVEKTVKTAHLKRGEIYTLTEWGRVIHVRSIADFWGNYTKCGLTPVEDLESHEAFTNSFQLCNGCFQ